MSLVDALSTPPQKTKIGRILAEVTPAEKEAVEKALRDPEWTSEALAAVLTDKVSQVSETSIRRYRRDVLGMKG